VEFFSRGGGVFWAALARFFGFFRGCIGGGGGAWCGGADIATRLSYTHTPLPLSYTSPLRSLALRIE